jgi:hypothetical protein
MEGGRRTCVVRLQALAADPSHFSLLVSRQASGSCKKHTWPRDGGVGLQADFFPRRYRAGADRTRTAKCGGSAGVWPWAAPVVSILKSANPWVGSCATTPLADHV